MLIVITNDIRTTIVNFEYTSVLFCQIRKEINYPLGHSDREPSTRKTKWMCLSLSITKRLENFTSQILYIYLYKLNDKLTIYFIDS